MRGIILAVLVCVVGTLATLILERLMTNAQEWIWRLAYSIVALGALLILLLTDPTFGWLRDFRNHPFVSTAAVAISAGLLCAVVWCFWIIGFPTSKGFLSNRRVSAEPEPKKQPFVISYLPGNCGFLLVEDSGINSKLNGRRALFVYDFMIVNNTDSITTLRGVQLTYEQGQVKRETAGFVFPVGTLKNGESALMVSSPKGHVFLVNWVDIRLIFAENKEKPAGAIWRGSAIFLLDENLESFEQVLNPKLVVRDYLDRESELSISPQVKSDLKVRLQKFVQHQDDSFSWVFP
jgi:hypothetical protein